MDPLEQLKDELRAVLPPIDKTHMQLRKQDQPESWTIQQVAEHLRLTYVRTREAMDVRLEKGVPTSTRVTLKGRFWQSLVTTVGYFPPKRKAPRIVAPLASEPLDGSAVYAAVAAEVDAMAAAIDKVEHVMGQGRTVNHAILGPMSVAQWRRFHLVHGRHHVRQILRIQHASLGGEAGAGENKNG